MERDSAVFYRSFYDASKDLPGEVQTDIYKAMFEYAFYKNEIDLQGTAKAIFTLIKPQLDANIKKYENGKNGGRPPKNENQEETKPKAKKNQEETKPKGNENVYASDNASLNSNSNVDVDANAEKITIAAAAELFLKNEKVVKAFIEDHGIKTIGQLKALQEKYHLHLEKKQISKKTYQDYINHFDSCLKKGILEFQNNGVSSTSPKRFDQDLGKMPRIGDNSSNNIPVTQYSIEQFKHDFGKPSYQSHRETLFKEFNLNEDTIKFELDEFLKDSRGRSYKEFSGVINDFYTWANKKHKDNFKLKKAD